MSCLCVKRNIVTLQQKNGSSAVNAKSGGMRSVPIMKMALIFVTIVSCTTKYFNITLQWSPIRYNGVTLNSRRAASPLVRLVEGQERWETSDHPQSVLPLNLGGIEPNRAVTCMVLKATANDRRHLALCHDEFCGPRSGLCRSGGIGNNNALQCITLSLIL
ncbi:UNVERIFIED_CONTAM: hypothetical protein NCL1_29555 [Trichonephila clavipes]